VQPAQESQPKDEPQLEQSRLFGVPAHAPGVSHPTQPPQPALVEQTSHVANVGVPLHVGPVLNTCGGGAASAFDVAQQMRAAPVQSLSDMHDLGHSAEQMPWQHSCPVAEQSVSAVHDLGQGSYIGLRHRPLAVSDESTVLTDVQQTSPMLV
jgi:hypothetical protein